MSEYVSFCFMFHVPHLLARLSRAIQHIFRHLAGAQYTDCITLPHQHTLCLGLHKPSQFRPFTYIYEFEQVYMCFIPNVSRLSIPPCPHRPSRVTMDHHPKGSASPSWRTESNPSTYLFASTHSVPLFPTKYTLPSSGFTSTEVKKHLHTPTVASRLRSQPCGRLPVRRPFKPLLPPTVPPHVDPYKRLNHLNHLVLTGQVMKRNQRYRQWMGGDMGGLPAALWKSHRGTCNNPSTNDQPH